MMRAYEGAIKFQDLMKHGLRQGGVMILPNGLPGSFHCFEYAVTPNGDGSYTFGQLTIKPGEVLVKFIGQEPEVWSIQRFDQESPHKRNSPTP